MKALFVSDSKNTLKVTQHQHHMMMIYQRGTAFRAHIQYNTL